MMEIILIFTWMGIILLWHRYVPSFFRYHPCLTWKGTILLWVPSLFDMERYHPSFTWKLTILVSHGKIPSSFGCHLLWHGKVPSFFWHGWASTLTLVFKNCILNQRHPWQGTHHYYFGMTKTSRQVLVWHSAKCKAPWVLNLQQFNVRSILSIHPFQDFSSIPRWAQHGFNCQILSASADSKKL